MKFKTLLTISALLALVMAVGFSLQPSAFSPAQAQAATANPSPASTGYTPMVLPIMGNHTSSRTAIVKWTAPNGYRVVNATAYARASSGTTPTLKIRAQSAGFTIFSTAGSLAAGTVKQATLAASPLLTDESAITFDTIITGTSPVWEDITVMMLLKRL